MTDTPGRRMRQAARRYTEGMEAERVDLQRQIAELTRQVDLAKRHHADAHPDCDVAAGPAAGPAWLVLNSACRAESYPTTRVRPIEFHRRMPGYAPTPCVDLGRTVSALGLRSVVVKNEQSRLGLPSYKVLGSSWALHQRLVRAAAIRDGRIRDLDELKAIARTLPRTLVCSATDGNHGRGLAAMAELLGLGCVIFVPRDTTAQRIADIARHGARVERIESGYDEAMRRAADESRAQGYWFCPDTAVDGDDGFSADVETGYETIFDELASQLARLPDAVFVQCGVGSLAAATVRAMSRVAPQCRIVSVEPEGSNAVQASIRAGRAVTVPDAFTAMAGLRSQSVSPAAWPILRRGLTAALTVSDEDAFEAMRVLAKHGVVGGESGAAGLAGLLRLGRERLLDGLGLDGSATVVVLNTEGATDEASYRAAMARRA